MTTKNEAFSFDKLCHTENSDDEFFCDDYFLSDEDEINLLLDNSIIWSHPDEVPASPEQKPSPLTVLGCLSRFTPIYTPNPSLTSILFKNIAPPTTLSFSNATVAADNSKENQKQTLLSNKDLPGANDFIFACKDRNSDKTRIIRANNKDGSMDELLSVARDFFKHNFGYESIDAAWIKTKKNKKSVARVITAKKKGDKTAKIIFISKNFDQYYVQRDCLNIANISSSHKFAPISTVLDVEFVIQGLLYLGDLAFDEKTLAEKGLDLKTMPKILIATLNFNLVPRISSDHSGKNRYILRMVGNDPIYAETSNKGLPNFDCSSYSFITRHKDLDLSANQDSVYLASLELAKQPYGKRWVLGTSPLVNDPFRYLFNRHQFQSKYISSSIVFSFDFLKAYLQATGRSFNLSARPVSGTDKAYYMSTLAHDKTSIHPFLADPVFHLSSTACLENDTSVISYDIKDLLIDNSHAYSNDKDLGEFLSKRLLRFFCDLYFNRYGISTDFYCPSSPLSTKFIEKAKIQTTSARGQEDIGGTALSFYSDAYFSVDISSLTFQVGRPLFDITFAKDGVVTTCSLFESCPQEGLISLSDDERLSYTILYSTSGSIYKVVRGLFFDETIKYLIDEMLSSSTATCLGMDRFDIMRELKNISYLHGYDLHPYYFR